MHAGDVIAGAWVLAFISASCCYSAGTSSAASWPCSVLTKWLWPKFALCLPQDFSALLKVFDGPVRGLMLQYTSVSFPPSAQ